MFRNGFGGFQFGGFPGFGQEMGDDDQQDFHEEKEEEIDNKGLYELLGVPHDATHKEIKVAFRKLARDKHPDKGGDSEQFKEITQAYDILSDEKKRSMYDKYGLKGIKEGMAHGGAGGNPFDVFGDLFGFGSRNQDPHSKQKKGKPQLKECHVKLEDVFTGKMIQIEHTRKRICEACDGKGGENVVSCKPCKGKGMVEKMIMLGPGMYQHSTQPCSECKGEGKIIDEKDQCKNCKGQKVLDKKQVLDVSVEPGCPNEHDYVYYGECDEYPGILGGDLHVRILIEEHKLFERKGADLFYDKEISLLEALTGFNFEITHLDGAKLNVTTLAQEIIQPDDMKIIKGKGMPFFKDSMTHGNLFIRFKVVFPKKGEINQNQVFLLKQVLPNPHQVTFKKGETLEYLEDFHDDDFNIKPEGGGSRHKQAHDEDDEDDQQDQGGQRVQCQQQ